jgi:hypothetical protein
MSILKRLLVEDLAPLFRRSLPDGQPSTAAAPTIGPEPVAPLLTGGIAKTDGSGMKVVILNWKSGENDPFTVINATIRRHFAACGKNVEIVEISEPGWVSQVEALAPAGVELAYTWQGLGSHAPIGEQGESLWDLLRIPLICVHGDHPSHMPLNHQLDARYCHHLYTNADFARYSNRHFRRVRGASVIDLPRLHDEPNLGARSGDYFVVAKNIYDPVETERLWLQRFERPVVDAYLKAAEHLKSMIGKQAYVEIHDVLDELTAEPGFECLSPRVNIPAYHQYHSQLDLYLRSYKTVLAVSSLNQFPLRIFGRGWDRIARSAPPNHMFEPGRNMADSQELFYTRFGLIDVSPSRGLHDRTRRAMANGTSFLSSANLEETFADIGRFKSLFFDFRPGDLAEKCSAVLGDPDAHLDLALRFARMYHDRFTFRNFVNNIDCLAKLSNALSALPVR